MNQEEQNKINSGTNFGLSKAIVLSGKPAFNRLFTKGKTVQGSVSAIRYLQLDSLSESTKVAFVVRKKLGSAVVRNRLKRLMREAYRINQSEFAFLVESKLSVHFAFMPKWSLLTYQQVETDIRLFAKVLRQKLTPHLN